MILDLKDLKTTSTKHIDKVFGGFIMSIPPIGLQLGMRDSAFFVKSSGKMIWSTEPKGWNFFVAKEIEEDILPMLF